VRNVLRRLRRLRASEDFEERLQLRIAEKESTEPGPGLPPRRIAGRRIPVFAYSLVSIVILGIVSYFLIDHVLFISPPSVERHSGSDGGKLSNPQLSDSLSPGIQDVQNKKLHRVDDIPAMKQAPSPVVEPAGVGAGKEEKAEGTSNEAARPAEQPAASEKAVSGKEPGSIRLALPERFPEKAMERSMTPMRSKYIAPVQPTFEAHPAWGGAVDSAVRNDSVKLDSLRKDFKSGEKPPKKKPPK